MSLTWMNNGFISKDLYAPFVLEKDSDYIDDLKKSIRLCFSRQNLRELMMKALRYSKSTEIRYWKR